MTRVKKIKHKFKGAGHHFCGRDIDDLIVKTMWAHLSHKQPDACLSIETHMFDVLLSAKSCAYTLDVGKELWLNVGRWSRLIKEYISKEALDQFLKLSKIIYQGDCRDGAATEMRFISPVRTEKKHRFGGCLMGVVFRGDKESTPTLTLYSRTTYLGYMALLDAAIIYKLAALITDGHPEKVAFKWYITSMQFHGFKSLPYMFTNKEWWSDLQYYEKFPAKVESDDLSPTWRILIKWYTSLCSAYDAHGIDMCEHEKYGPFKRVKRRWMEHQKLIDKNIPPSLPVSELTFEKAQ